MRLHLREWGDLGAGGAVEKFLNRDRAVTHA